MIPVLLVLIFIASYLGTLIVIKIATKKNIMDVPNIRSSHIQPTPRGGGLAIAFTWYAGIIVLLLAKRIPDYLFASLLCGIPITIVGMMDDIINISPKLRLIVQIICASFAVYFLHGCNFISLGFTDFHFPILFNIIAVLGIVWFINLFNFLDGIDGYISVEILFICLAAFILTGSVLPLLLAAATAGFLIWNWQPAKIFMGDVGSTLLGFTIGIFTVYYPQVNNSSIFIWLMLTSLFWFDATITLIRRLRNHEQLSRAHRNHCYQRIVQSGFTHKKTVIFSCLINMLMLGLIFLAVLFPKMILLLFCLNLIYLYTFVRLVDKKFPFKKI